MFMLEFRHLTFYGTWISEITRALGKGREKWEGMRNRLYVMKYV